MSVFTESNDSFLAPSIRLDLKLDLLVMPGLLSSSLSPLSNEVMKSSILFDPPKLPSSDKGFAGTELFLFESKDRGFFLFNSIILLPYSAQEVCVTFFFLNIP